MSLLYQAAGRSYTRAHKISYTNEMYFWKKNRSLQTLYLSKNCDGILLRHDYCYYDPIITVAKIFCPGQIGAHHHKAAYTDSNKEQTKENRLNFSAVCSDHYFHEIETEVFYICRCDCS